MQIQVLERQTQEMAKEQESFKKNRDALMQQYYEQKSKENMTPQEEEEEKMEIDEEMQILDEKIQEIEDFNKRNFKVDSTFIDLFQDLYDKYEEEILTAPFVEYSDANRPSWYP